MITRRYCQDCKKELVSSRYMGTKRCQKCYIKTLKGRTYKWSEEAKQSKMGQNNPEWKGDKVGYNAKHAWVRRHKQKPELCEECKTEKPRDLANISGEYKRD